MRTRRRGWPSVPAAVVAILVAGRPASVGPQEQPIAPGATEGSGANSILGAPCSDDAACGQGHCSNGRCAPPGFAYVLNGDFMMGAPEGEPGSEGDQRPVHDVEITRPFFLGETEVTQGEWRAVMGTDPSFFSSCGDACPVERVSWWDAVEYLNRRSEAEGLEPCYALSGCSGTAGGGCAAGERSCGGDFACSGLASANPDCEGYRLATEAEWEYAYRAGETTAFYNGAVVATQPDDCDSSAGTDANLDAIGWYCQDRPRSTQPTRTKLPNRWGLYDASGNVWEWVWDWWDPASYEWSTREDPRGPEVGLDRLARGGAWSVGAWLCRAASRRGTDPSSRSNSLGFRIARSLPTGP